MTKDNLSSGFTHGAISETNGSRQNVAKESLLGTFVLNKGSAQIKANAESRHLSIQANL